MSLSLSNPAKTLAQIETFIKDTYQQQDKESAVMAVSGGIDSSLSLTLLAKSLGPTKIRPLFLPYGQQDTTDAESILEFNQIPEENWLNFNIKPSVEVLAQTLNIPTEDRVRLGNVMARIRMVFIYDQAKKNQALVCGTENKSEKYLGYFTRFGDEASDLEPIINLYKTQVWQLAKFLKLPAKIIEKSPSAGLWTNQTDEKELGFSYEAADQVLSQLIDRGVHPNELKVEGLETVVVKKIVKRVKKMSFKQAVPYTIESSKQD